MNLFIVCQDVFNRIAILTFQITNNGQPLIDLFQTTVIKFEACLIDDWRHWQHPEANSRHPQRLAQLIIGRVKRCDFLNLIHCLGNLIQNRCLAFI